MRDMKCHWDKLQEQIGRERDLHIMITVCNPYYIAEALEFAPTTPHILLPQKLSYIKYLWIKYLWIK